MPKLTENLGICYAAIILNMRANGAREKNIATFLQRQYNLAPSTSEIYVRAILTCEDHNEL